MPNVLIRDVPAPVHENIVARAASAGRSMQSELLEALCERYAPSPARSLLDILLSAAGSDVGVVRDTPVRDFSFEDGA